jgi:TatD DNase family protein
MLTPYLNIHSHAHSDFHENVIYSFDAIEWAKLALSPPRMSVGLHPWYVDPLQYAQQMQALEIALEDKHCVLLGECGLDRLKGPPISFQWQALDDQTELALQHNKPMIFHCVRAFDLLLGFRKKPQAHIPMIVHGFRGTPELAQQLTRKGFYLSFGPPILQNPDKARHLFEQLHQPFFLETDEHPMPIDQFYTEIANLLKIDLEELKDRIFAAWKLIGLQENE